MSNVVRMPGKFPDRPVPLIGKRAEEKQMEAFMNQLLPRKEILMIAQQIAHQEVVLALEWVAERIPEVRAILDEAKAQQEAARPPAVTISNPDDKGASVGDGGGATEGDE